MRAVGATRKALVGAAGIGVLASLVLIVPQALAANPPIVVWADQIRADVLNAEYPQGFRGIKIKVVVKDSLAAIKDELKTVKPADAPDVIAAEHESTGELVEAKLVRSLVLGKERLALFPPNVLSGFRYNGKIFGVPVQFENLAMVTNVNLVPKQPETFKKVVTISTRLMKNNKTSSGVAVGQGGNGNAYNMFVILGEKQ